MPEIHVMFGPLAGFVVEVDEDQLQRAVDGKWAVEYGSTENPSAGLSTDQHYAMLDDSYAAAEELKDARKRPHESTESPQPE